MLLSMFVHHVYESLNGINVRQPVFRSGRWVLFSSSLENVCTHLCVCGVCICMYECACGVYVVCVVCCMCMCALVEVGGEKQGNAEWGGI